MEQMNEILNLMAQPFNQVEMRFNGLDVQFEVLPKDTIWECKILTKDEIYSMY